ncbi:MAG: C_GCAxxG_C_C family protein [Clostridiales bacterium]|nr:C_GCAxxG_C_C family protein [Clostridiales bacterium]
MYEENVVRLYELLQKGLCCSQALLQTGLETGGKENPDLIRAVSGLCLGMQSGMVCGALTGGACLLSMLKPEGQSMFLVNDLAEWFREKYGELYGGVDCNDILAGDVSRKTMVCPDIITSVYQKVMELLEEYGYAD